MEVKAELTDESARDHHGRAPKSNTGSAPRVEGETHSGIYEATKISEQTTQVRSHQIHFNSTQKSFIHTFNNINHIKERRGKRTPFHSAPTAPAALQDILNGAQHDCTKNDNVSGSIRTNNYKRAHTLDLLCIRRTCIMRVYLLGCSALVEADEPMEEVVACGVVIGSSLVVGEVVLFVYFQEMSLDPTEKCIYVHFISCFPQTTIGDHSTASNFHSSKLGSQSGSFSKLSPSTTSLPFSCILEITVYVQWSPTAAITKILC